MRRLRSQAGAPPSGPSGPKPPGATGGLRSALVGALAGALVFSGLVVAAMAPAGDTRGVFPTSPDRLLASASGVPGDTRGTSIAKSGTEPIPGWRRVSDGAPFERATSVALLSGRALVSDGKTALLEDGGVFEAVEAEVSLTRVFAAGGRLFATGTGDGPFLVDLTDREARVTPMPCTPVLLEGRDTTWVAACEEGGIAVSRDGARTFLRGAWRVPSPPDAPAEVVAAIDALAISPSPDPKPLIASSVRWTSLDAEGAPLLWSFTQVSGGPGASQRAVAAPGVHRILGLAFAGGAGGTAVGVALGGERPYFFRLEGGEAVVRTGEQGPECPPEWASGPGAGPPQGVLLSPRTVAILCGGQVILGLDGGERWERQALPEPVERLFGGAMRLVATTPRGVFERRFDRQSESGAEAVRVDSALEQKIREAAKPLPPIEVLKNATPLPTHTVIQEPPIVR